ncbi:lysophospholipid acyltransferase family protein [Crenalkalicoccus roseus]|uniref:lysophospholipid acyltransferase family protein n=1 Tax=Crenalkalicoccus roseus TaxID=1485588 RepID=UPI00108106FF|nr:lysophospholipid acyltransferase family protein [Crenalkalicoccus roseus]
MIWLRSALFNLAFYLGSAALAVLALPLLLAPRRAVVAVMRLWSRAVLALLRAVCGIRVRVVGAEHLPRTGAALIAAKHQSAFDTIVWLGLLPDAAYVLKRELLHLPVYGWLARKARMIAVDRRAGPAAMRHLIRAGREAAAEGRQIVIFPEGTRVAPGARVRYQPGIAALAAATGLPVIPAATDSGLYWARRAFLRRPGVITLSILPPLPPGLPREALMTRLEQAIEEESQRLLAGPAAKGGEACG